MNNVAKSVLLGLILVVCPALLAPGCGSTKTSGSSFDPAKAILADNEAPGWVEKVSSVYPQGVTVCTPADVATTCHKNGSATTYINNGMVAYYAELFQKGSQEVTIEVWDMGNSTNAKTVYDHVRGTLTTPTAISVGDEASMAQSIAVWTMIFRDDKYYIILTSNGTESAFWAEMQAMATKISQKISQ